MMLDRQRDIRADDAAVHSHFVFSAECPRQNAEDARGDKGVLRFFVMCEAEQPRRTQRKSTAQYVEEQVRLVRHHAPHPLIEAPATGPV